EVSRMRVFFLYKNCLATLLPICPFDIFVYSTQTSLLPGDLITLSSVHFKKPISVSFYQYLMKENIYATVFTSTVHAHLLLRPSFSFYRSYHGMYTHLHETLFAKLNPTTSPYFSLLFLGEKKDMHANFLFQKWGIAHYAARSGLHLTIFIFIWEFLLSIIPIPYFLKQLFLLLLCCVYAFLSKNATSFLRAFVLFLLGKFYATQKITTYFLHLLSVVCCIFLLYNPFLLFCLDFQLSFVLTYALVWISLIHITA
ncbi:MAG TPA: ComEC/Rec2 family competence protein, partial [Candidatus Bathyarchaeia archaeon]|nr:ComEC/Rec2 family competence protein [Candidatus Bathyarchaeia archaeon]